MPDLFDRIPQKYSILLTGPKSVDKTALGIDLMMHYLEKGEKVILMSTDSGPERIKSLFSSRRIELGKYSDRFIIIDCFTPWAAAGTPESPEYAMSTQPDVDALRASILKATSRLAGNVHVFIDSASSVFLHNGNLATLGFLHQICAGAGKDYDSVMLILHDKVHEEKTLSEIRTMVNGVIETRSDDELNILMRFARLNGAKTEPGWQQFKVTDTGIVFEDPHARADAQRP